MRFDGNDHGEWEDKPTPSLIEEMAEAIRVACQKDAARHGAGVVPPKRTARHAGAAAAKVMRERMREPSNAMLEASNREWDGRMSYRSSGAWQATLDAFARENDLE